MIVRDSIPFKMDYSLTFTLGIVLNQENKCSTNKNDFTVVKTKMCMSKMK